MQREKRRPSSCAFVMLFAQTRHTVRPTSRYMAWLCGYGHRDKYLHGAEMIVRRSPAKPPNRRRILERVATGPAGYRYYEVSLAGA